eukprot:scaffold1318_cov388-Prasinococcus_capsulatus_cf.AAC.32
MTVGHLVCCRAEGLGRVLVRNSVRAGGAHGAWLRSFAASRRYYTGWGQFESVVGCRWTRSEDTDALLRPLMRDSVVQLGGRFSACSSSP